MVRSATNRQEQSFSILALLTERDESTLPVEPCSEHRFPCHAAFASAPLAPVWIQSRGGGVHVQIKSLILLLAQSSECLTRALCKAPASCSQVPTKGWQCSLPVPNLEISSIITPLIRCIAAIKKKNIFQSVHSLDSAAPSHFVSINSIEFHQLCDLISSLCGAFCCRFSKFLAAVLLQGEDQSAACWSRQVPVVPV